MKFVAHFIAITAATMLLLVQSTQAVDHSADNSVTGNYPAVNVFRGGEDVLGQAIAYPNCEPEIHSVVITMVPGQVGAVHQHVTPLYVEILSGKISVTYETEGGITKTYHKGDAFMEAMHVMHHGFNPFDEPVQLLGVYLNCAGA